MRLILLYIILFQVAGQAYGQFSAREYFKFGKNKYDDGKYFEAIDFLDKAVEQDPEYENAYFLRGEAFLELEKFKLAIDDFTRIIDMRNSSDTYAAEYYLKRASARMALKDFQAAEKDIEMALRLNPENADAFYELARYKYMTLKDKNEAINELNRAIQHDPDEPRYYIQRANYKAYKAKFDFNGDDLYVSAVRDVTFAITLDPDNFDYYLLRSHLNKARGEPMEAIADYNKMIELDPYRIEAYSERGVIKMQNDKYRSAIQDFTQAIELDPGREEHFRYRGLCRHNIQEFNGAYEDYTKSIQLLRDELKRAQEKETVRIKRILADTYIKRGAAITSTGNTLNACSDFRMAYELGSKLGLNYLRKYCGI